MLQCNSRVTVTVSVNLGNLAGNQCIITIICFVGTICYLCLCLAKNSQLSTLSYDKIGIRPTCTIKLAFNSGT